MANSCQTAGVLEIKMVENHCYKVVKIFSYGGPWSVAHLGVLDMKKFENHWFTVPVLFTFLSNNVFNQSVTCSYILKDAR